MKKKPHQWPTDGATRKYVDRVNDRLTVRLDRQNEKIRALKEEIMVLGRLVRAFIGDQAD